jgi:hypothetical protein
MKLTTAACLRCSAICPAPLMHGFCPTCWTDVIVPGAEEADALGVLSREACIGLLSDVYAELRRDAVRSHGALVQAALAELAADSPSRRVLCLSGGAETDFLPDPLRDLQS